MEKIISLEKLNGLTLEHVIRDDFFTMSSTHFHPEFEIYYLYKGSRSYFIEDHVYPVKAGTLIFIAADKIHKTTDLYPSTDKNPSHERLLLLLDEKFYCSFFDMANALNLQCFFKEYSGVLTLTCQEKSEIEKILFIISNEMIQKQEGNSFLIHSKITELLLFIMRKYKLLHTDKMIISNNTTSSSAETVSNIASYISENLTADCSLEKIAAHFFISKYYLCRLFKSSTGLTINEYLNMKRVKKAKYYLETTTFPITKISELSGYDTLTHFERIFRKYTNQSPLQYRKNYKTDI